MRILGVGPHTAGLVSESGSFYQYIRQHQNNYLYTVQLNDGHIKLGEDGDYPSNTNLVQWNDYENFGWVEVQVPKNVNPKEFTVGARLTGATRVGSISKSRYVDLSFHVKVPNFDIVIEPEDKAQLDKAIPTAKTVDYESSWDIEIPADVNIGENITYSAKIDGKTYK